MTISNIKKKKHYSKYYCSQFSIYVVNKFTQTIVIVWKRL